MANTYELIEAKTLTTTTASITFSAIPATYTDLKVSLSARTTATGDYRIFVYPNGSTTNLSSKNLYADGSSAASVSYSNGAIGFLIDAANETANTFGNGDIYFPNYSSANAKSFSLDGAAENNATSAYSGLAAGLWNNTSAISSLQIAPTQGSFVQYSSFYLYGIKNS
jgi:hypothetical protein